MFVPAETACAGQHLELRLVEQAAAREDIGLDEVRVADVAVEQFVADRDVLQSSTSAGPQIAGDAVEVRAPPALANRLDHLDRGDGVELLGGVAIVREADFDPVRETLVSDLLLGPGFLLFGQRQADDLGAAPGRLDRQRAPATTDLEQSLARLELEPIEQHRDLVQLRGLQAVRR